MVVFEFFHEVFNLLESAFDAFYFETFVVFDAFEYNIVIMGVQLYHRYVVLFEYFNVG